MKSNKVKAKKIIFRKIGLLSGLLVITTTILMFLLNLFSTPSTKDPTFTKYLSYYDGNQVQIKSEGDIDEVDTITMTYASNNGNSSNKVITIENNNELDLLSSMCKSNEDFLGYSYKLIANINYPSTSNFSVIGTSNKPFTGVFDGNGYSIINLRMVISQNETYSEKHFGMFAYNSGTVKQLGLEYPEIAISNASNLTGVAYLVGENNGTLEYSYVIDDEDVVDKFGEKHETAGIGAYGGTRIATLVASNNSTMQYNYAAVSIVFNYKVEDLLEYNNIVLDNSGTVSSCYFYDKSIQTTSISNDNSKITINYKSSYGIDSRTNPYYGVYCKDDTTLITNIKAAKEENEDTSGWYISSDYSNFASNIDIPYAIRRGVSVTENQHGEGEDTYYTLDVEINNEKDFAYMYELFNTDDKFASDAITYKINANINLDKLPVESYIYNKVIASKITGTELENVSTPKLANNKYAIYPTIYNGDIFNSNRIVKSTGVDCYGLFNYVSGEISNLNIIPNVLDFKSIDTTSSNVKGIGVVAGYVEGGLIDNVNIYATISSSKDVGEYYLGGITGVLGGEGKLSNVTSAGSITLSSVTSTIPQTSSYMGGIAVGGVVGYIESSQGALHTCLNAMDITSYLGTSTMYTIAGVLGSGYTMNYSNETNNIIYTSNLENVGDITIGSSSYKTYSSLYVAGVIGRQFGLSGQVSSLANNGDVKVYTNGNTTYVSGVINVDLVTSSVTNTGLSASLYKNTAGNNIFYGSAYTNGGEISVDGSSTNLNYTNVINLNAAGVVSTLTGIYNLSYNKKFDLDNTNDNLTRTTNKLDSQSINMNLIENFAPVLNVIGGTSTYTTSVESIYNLRNLEFSQTNAITKDLTYTGLALGEYISYDDARNEGIIKINITSQFGTSKDKRNNLIVAGLFKEISGGMHAYDVYNSGDIDVTYTAMVYGNIYASGICYSNLNGFSDTELKYFNPTDNEYNKSKIGSLNNVINNGKITVTNTNYSNLAFTSYVDIKSANGSVTTERHYSENSAPSANLVGNISASGITNYNYSVITNTFNIADIFAANYITNNGSREEVNASGLVTYNIGNAAIIENCANDGVIKAINLSFYMVFSNGQSTVNTLTAEYAFVNSSGIVCKNDATSEGGTYNNDGGHASQIIAFTINYGSIFSYNFARNSTSSASEAFRTISAGILGEGLLNLVNVLNYGNIYGSEVSGGIVGVMFFDSFNTEVNENNTVTLANTINYSNVLVIDKGELNYRDSTYHNQTYDSFISLTSSTSDTYYVSLDVYSKDYFNGSIFGIINFSGSTNANFVTIRYLISFNEDVTLVGAEAQTPSNVTVDLSTFYSAYVLFDGSYTLDTYIGKNVIYSPLSTGTQTINGTTYYGVFNKNFAFYKAIKGVGLDTTNHITDIFISDYFEFIGATYVNQVLLDKIGWGAIAYNAAAETFATSIEGVAKFITYLSENNSTEYNNLITAALQTDTWISKCSTEDLLKIVDCLIENEQDSELLSMLEYIFTTGSTSYSLITTETRSKILEELVENDASLDYSTLIESIITYSNGYSSVLADSILNDDDAGTYIYNYLDSLSNSNLEEILTTYCNYLKDSETNAYFSYSNTEMVRYDILASIFENINDSTFYTNLASILEIDLSSISLSDEIKMYNGLNALSDSQLIEVYKAIILNNSYANMATYVSTMSDEINYYTNMINRGYLKTSLDNIYSDTSSTTSSSATTVIDERVALWNQIRTTDTFKNYLLTKITSEYIAKATEVNNTYQTTTYPYESALSSQGDLSFTYTFDITPSTYFLGPYKNTSKNQFDYSPMTNDIAPTCGDNNYTARSIIDVTTKAEADYLYNNGYTKFYQLFYYEYSDSSSNNQLCAVRRYINGSIENKYAFTWFKTSYTTDFTGGFLRGTYTDVNDSWVEGESWVDEAIWVTDTSGVTFDANGGGISKFTSYSSGSTNEGGYANNLTRTGTWVITDANQKQHTITGTLTDWADFIIAHEIRHYISYPTEELHSTLCTGLGKYRSGNRWFVWNGNPVYSSQYIDYDVEQLLKLDGYLTAYSDGTTASEDERNIINDIFNTYFVTDSTNFNNMVASALLEKNSQIDNDSYYYVGTPEFNYTTRNYYRLTATAATSYDENTTYYKKSGNDYLVAYDVNNSNYSSYYTIAVTRVYDYYNYSDCYIMKDCDDYDLDYIHDFMINNIYSSTTISSSIPFEYLDIPTSISSGSLITVKQFLTNLATTSNIKDNFIGYCANNQQAYAKLLLELMRLKTIESPLSTVTFPSSIGDSDTSGVTIDNMSYYTNLSVVYNEVTINDTEYNYGYTFEIIKIDVNTSNKILKLYLNSTSSVNLYYMYDTSSNWDGYVTVNGSEVVEISLNNNSYVYLDVVSGDVGNIALYYAEESAPTSTNGNISYNVLTTGTAQSGTDGNPGYIMYQLPTSATIEALIENELESNNITYDEYTYTISATIKSHCNESNGNQFYFYHRFVIDSDGSTNTTDGTVLATSTAIIQNNQIYTETVDLDNSYLESYIGLQTTKDTNWTYYTGKRGNGTYRVRFYSIDFDIKYETISYGEDNVLITPKSILNSVIGSITNEEYCTIILKNDASYNTKYSDMLLDATYNLVPIDYSSTLLNPVQTGTASKNIIEILGLSEEHQLDGDYCVPELLSKLITTSNEAFKSFISNSISISEKANSDYSIILKYLTNSVGHYSLNDAIKSGKITLSTEAKEMIASAYLVTDYKVILTNNTTVSDSYLKTYVDVLDTNYQYINADNTYDFDKFTAFCKLIGYDLSTEGFGIYALASNQGKENGTFIPDNLSIASMDDPYSYENDVLMLQNDDSSYWRGGSTNTEGSVNYAFNVDMKQVTQSISTAVFDLVLKNGNSLLYGDIDVDDATITFYVTSITSGDYDVNKITLANKATCDLSSKITVPENTNSGDVITTFTVTAENTNVTKEYSVIFVILDTSFDLSYLDGTNSKTMLASETSHTLELKVESPSDDTKDKLPEGLDLEPYITFVNGTTSYSMSSTHLTISSLSTDHRVKEDGSSIITIVVSSSLPAAEYNITLSICGKTDSVTFKKNANSESIIKSGKLDGEDVSFEYNSETNKYEATSKILYGRAYDYLELTDYTDSNFYLYNFTYSNNATVSIDASYSIDDNTGLMTYIVTYTITAEDLSESIYVHTLKEKQYFDENSIYASLYADGTTVQTKPDNYDSLSDENKVNYLSDGTFTYNLAEDMYNSETNSWSTSDDMFMKVSFNRSTSSATILEPQYRVKYNLSNFYILGEITYDRTDATKSNKATSSPSYAGLTVTVSEKNDTGEYVFVYTYSSKGIWENGDEYYRYYELPELRIEKLASTDALLHKLTFLEESIVLGNTSTVILPTTVMIPQTGSGDTYDSSDVVYSSAFDSSFERTIGVTSTGIDYNTEASATTVTDYYAIGTVSDADLSYYCPTFGINDYAQMYQYTTLNKLQNYGADNNQAVTDKSILSDHSSTTYLYVPMIYNNVEGVYLVELDSNNNWTNVYNTSYTGEEDALFTFTGTVNAKNAKGKTQSGYTVSSNSGEVANNISLYMNYVGTPLDGHFWYVSYVIFSEDALNGEKTAGNIRYYHISIIDATNTIQFNVSIYAQSSMSLEEIFLTITENLYTKKTGNNYVFNTERQISAYAEYKEDVESYSFTAKALDGYENDDPKYKDEEVDVSGYKLFELTYLLQTLPSGYFKFFVDLPAGYVAKSYTDKRNRLYTDSSACDNVSLKEIEEGTYLAPTSIITQKIALAIVITEGDTLDSGVWAVKTSTLYNRQATYGGYTA